MIVFVILVYLESPKSPRYFFLKNILFNKVSFKSDDYILSSLFGKHVLHLEKKMLPCSKVILNLEIITFKIAHFPSDMWTGSNLHNIQTTLFMFLKYQHSGIIFTLRIFALFTAAVIATTVKILKDHFYFLYTA